MRGVFFVLIGVGLLLTAVFAPIPASAPKHADAWLAVGGAILAICGLEDDR